MTILACNVCGGLVDLDPADVLSPRCSVCGSGEIHPVNDDDDDEQEGSK